MTGLLRSNSASSYSTVDKPPALIRAEEWRFVWAAIGGVLVVTSLPYIFGYLTAPPGKQFMGILINVPDHAQYFSWFRQYVTSDLAANLLTPEPNRPIFFNLLWWLLAKAGRLLGWDYAAMFQVLRVTATAAFMLMLYRLCAWFLDDQLQRRTAFLVAVFASGFGWLLIVCKYLFGWEYPLEINLLIFIVEPNSFFAMLATPHLTGAALYMFAFDLTLRGEAKGQLRYAAWAGLFTLFLGFQHAYDLILVYGILGAYGLLKIARDRRVSPFLLQAGLIIGLLSVWPALYSVLLTSLDPVWREVLAQFDNAGVFTPNPLLLPVLLGPAFLLALFAVIKGRPLALADIDDRGLFLRAWFWMNAVLIYLPTDYQIKMLNGWQVPIAILAVHGAFTHSLPWIRQMSGQRLALLRRGVAVLLVVVVVPTNLYLWAWRFVDLGRHEYPYYLHADEVAALRWLGTQGESGDVVLSSLTLGQYVPMLAGKQAFLAHWAQTVDYYGKASLVDEVLGAATPEARRAQILSSYSVDYLVYGPGERAAGGFQPANSPLLRLVYSSPLVEIYEAQH